MSALFRQLLAVILSSVLVVPACSEPKATTRVTDALGQVTSYGYDEVGNRITQTDANSHATSYVYDQLGRRTRRILPLGQSESYTYDAAGNVATRTDFNGKTTTYAYDAANRLLSKTPDASFHAAAVTFTYDTNGERASMTDPSGTTNYYYDTQGRLDQKNFMLYSYDQASNVTQIQSGLLTVNYSYDALNRLSTVRESNSGTTSYSYDNVGNLATVTYPNGVVHTYACDNRNRLTNLGVTGTVSGAPGRIASYAYTVDAAGHRTSVTELSGRTVNYAYDNLYRLTNETIAGDPAANNGAVTYTYDPVGNRTQKVSTLPGLPGGLTNYNANDQLATDTYDANGNTTASTGLGYAYDFENHLIQQGGITMVYDGDGNRVRKTAGGVTTSYTVDTQNPTGYVQVIEEDFSLGAPAQAQTYVYGLERISEQRFVNTTQTIYYVYDGHGSVRALSNASGAQSPRTTIRTAACTAIPMAGAAAFPACHATPAFVSATSRRPPPLHLPLCPHPVTRKTSPPTSSPNSRSLKLLSPSTSFSPASSFW